MKNKNYKQNHPMTPTHPLLCQVHTNTSHQITVTIDSIPYFLVCRSLTINIRAGQWILCYGRIRNNVVHCELVRSLDGIDVRLVTRVLARVRSSVQYTLWSCNALIYFYAVKNQIISQVGHVSAHTHPDILARLDSMVQPRKVSLSSYLFYIYTNSQYKLALHYDLL